MATKYCIATHSLPLRGMEERIRKKIPKVRLDELRERQFNRMGKEEIIIIIIIEYTEQVVHNTIAHHLLTDPGQSSNSGVPWPAFPPVYILDMTSFGIKYPFGLFGSSLCPLPASRALPASPGRAV